MKPDSSHPTPEVIAVVSQSKGVGKTATAVNLSLALAAAGRTVLLMDLDPSGNVAQSLVRGSYGGGGTERALMETIISRDMIAATEIPELYLAPAGPGLAGVEAELTPMGDSRTRLYQALATLQGLPTRFDHIVIDCPSALGLLTLNALTAAHRVLVPLSCDSAVLEGLSSLLTTIGRLRAGLSQPFYGVYLLISRCQDDGSDAATIASVRRDFGRMTLLTEIPDDPAVAQADANERPLIVDTSSGRAAQAYLSLAAEWLTLAEPGDQPDGAWRFKARQERISEYRAAMIRRIEAWLIDPSSLLYDEREAMRHQDSQALEELFGAAQPGLGARLGSGLSGRAGRALLVAALALLVLVPLLLAVRHWAGDGQARIELAARLIGPDRYWQAGSLLLSRADSTAYREIQLAARLLRDNREQLVICGEQARIRATPVSCPLEVSPP